MCSINHQTEQHKQNNNEWYTQTINNDMIKSIHMIFNP